MTAEPCPSPPRLAAALAALGLVAGAAVAQPEGSLPDPLERAAVFEGHGRLPPALLQPPPGPLGLQDDVDVLDYDLSIWLDVPASRVEGTCRIGFVPSAPVLPALELDLHSTEMSVAAVAVLEPPGVSATYLHASDKLTITFDPPLDAAAGRAVVSVEYAGAPRQLSFGTLRFSTHGEPPAPLIFSLAEPFLARGWWPCKDRPDDKALVTLRVEAPDDLVVVSNGLEQGRQPGRAGHSITTWSSAYPITTYLVSIAVSDYASWTETYDTVHPVTGLPVAMPISHWSWPERLDDAREAWNVTLPMMQAYAQVFGEYPFLDEKYGHAMIQLGGAMEHQTATSYGAALVLPNHRFDFVVAHELAHQWWGDLVSPSSFDSIWLNEGFASWSEALWFEMQDGWPRYRDYMVRSLAPYDVEFPGTVHDPVALFNDTVYHKGAWVLHMLRWVLGLPSLRPDAVALLEELRAWGEVRAFSSASTADFVAHVSDRAGPLFGAPLADWFFPQWLHREGRPAYRVGWCAAEQPDGTYRTFLRVEQAQGGAPYAMPVLLRVDLPSGAHEEVAWNDQLVFDQELVFAERPTGLGWDPDDWVLKWVETVDVDADDDGWPDWIDGCPLVPNPAQEDLDGDGLQDACQPGLDFDGDGTPNELDCAPADGQAWTEAVQDTMLRVRREPATGAPVLSFEHPVIVGERPFSADVARGDLTVARAAMGPVAADCVAESWSGEWTDTLPGQQVYYLAWPVHGCTEPPAGVPGESDPCR